MWQKHAYKLHSLEYKVRKAKGKNTLFEGQYNQPYVIGVCGGSGSGKTTFCKQLVKYLVQTMSCISAKMLTIKT